MGGRGRRGSVPAPGHSRAAATEVAQGVMSRTVSMGLGVRCPSTCLIGEGSGGAAVPPRGPEHSWRHLAVHQVPPQPLRAPELGADTFRQSVVFVQLPQFVITEEAPPGTGYHDPPPVRLVQLN